MKSNHAHGFPTAGCGFGFFFPQNDINTAGLRKDLPGCGLGGCCRCLGGALSVSKALGARGGNGQRGELPERQALGRVAGRTLGPAGRCTDGRWLRTAAHIRQSQANTPTRAVGSRGGTGSTWLHSRLADGGSDLPSEALEHLVRKRQGQL